MHCRQLQGGILESFDTSCQYANSFQVINLPNVTVLCMFTFFRFLLLDIQSFTGWISSGIITLFVRRVKFLIASINTKVCFNLSDNCLPSLSYESIIHIFVLYISHSVHLFRDTDLPSIAFYFCSVCVKYKLCFFSLSSIDRR